MCDLPVPRIEVFQYLGYNGGFARERQLLWYCNIIGVNGEKRHPDQNTWHGNSERKYADRSANDWRTFTGWPVIDRGRVKAFDDPIKEGRTR